MFWKCGRRRRRRSGPPHYSPLLVFALSRTPRLPAFYPSPPPSHDVTVGGDPFHSGAGLWSTETSERGSPTVVVNQYQFQKSVLSHLVKALVLHSLQGPVVIELLRSPPSFAPLQVVPPPPPPRTPSTPPPHPHRAVTKQDCVPWLNVC